MLKKIIMLIFILYINSFGMYILKIPFEDVNNLKEVKQKLSEIGIEKCKMNDNVLECLYTDDINQALRIRDYLENNGIYSFIEEVSSRKEYIQEKKNNIKAKKVEKKKRKLVKKNKNKELKNITKNAYCIQVASSSKLRDVKNIFKKVKNLPLSRIEKIGNLYTIRVGLSKNYSEIKKLLPEVRKYSRDAFIRKCDYYPDRIIDINKKNSNPNMNYIKSNTIKTSQKNVEKNLVSKLKTSTKTNKVALMYQYLNEGNLTQAEKLAKELKNKYRYKTEAQKVLGIIAIKKGNFGYACKTLSAVYRETKSDDVKKMFFDSCYTYALRQGYKKINISPDMAIKYFQKALEFKKSIDPQIGIGYAYLNKKDYQKAYEIFKNLYNKYPNNKKILQGYVTVLLNLKKFDELENLKNKLSEKQLKEIEDLYVYVEIQKINKLIDRGKLNEAEEKLRRLYVKYPSNIYILLTLGNLYYKKGEYEKAKDYYNNVLIIDPENVYALEGLKGVYVKEKNYKEALKITEKLKSLGIQIEDEDKIKELYFLELAESHKKQGNYNKAVEYYKKVLDLNPDNAFALMGIGDFYYEKGNNEKALKFYSKGYEKNPENFDIKLKFLYSLLNLNLYDQIFSILETINKEKLTNKQKTKLKEFYKSLYEKYSAYLYDQGKYKLSLKVAKEGLLMFPVDEKLLSTAGWSCYKLKKYKCAERYFESAYNINKDEKIGLALAYVYFNDGEKKKLKNILTKLEKSKNPETLVEVANIYLSIGEDKKAEEIINKVGKLEKSKSIIKTKKLKTDEPEYLQEIPKTKIKRTDKSTIIPNPFIETYIEEDTDESLENLDEDLDTKKKDNISYKPLRKVENLKKKINLRKQNSISNISVGMKYRFKDGVEGTNKLYIFSPYITFEKYFNKYFSIYGGISYPSISSGNLNNYNNFGNVNLPVVRNIKTNQAGIEPFIGVNYQRYFLFQLEAGSTPIGDTPVNNTYTGKFMIGKYWNDNKLRLILQRKSEKNTLISYVGSDDPHSFNSWGRVIEEQIKIQYEKLLDKNDSLIFGDISYSNLKGKNTHKNNKFELSLFPKFYMGSNMADIDYLGLYFNYTTYQKDEDFYYYGFGGYFSPKQFIMITPTYEGFFFYDNKKTAIFTKLMAGIMNIETSIYTDTTLAFDGVVIGESLISKRLSIKGGIELRKTSSYTEFFALLSLNYYFGSKILITKKDLQKTLEWMIK